MTLEAIGRIIRAPIGERVAVVGGSIDAEEAEAKRESSPPLTTPHPSPSELYAPQQRDEQRNSFLVSAADELASMAESLKRLDSGDGGSRETDEELESSAANSGATAAALVSRAAPTTIETKATLRYHEFSPLATAATQLAELGEMKRKASLTEEAEVEPGVTKARLYYYEFPIETGDESDKRRHIAIGAQLQTSDEGANHRGCAAQQS